MDVEKIKQKILDLAIRGKLVPQDPNDEPASVLIEKIKAEKAKLVKEGKIKASKEESYIFKGSDNFYYEKIGNKTTCIQDEIPFEIPSTWQWTRINNIGEIIGGGTPSTANIEYWDKGDIVWITPAYMSRLDTPFINDSDRKITTEGLRHSSAKLMPAGSIIMSSRAPIGYLAINNVPACTSQGCKSLVPYITETNMYILNAIKASIGRVIESSKGTTFDEISGTQFGNILIPLPPIVEQTKINELISKAFEVLTKIADNNQLISRYTKSVKGKILELFFGENSSYKSYYKNGFLIDDVEIYDNLRKPISLSEREKRLEKAQTLYPYFGATGQTGVIDDYILEGEYVLLGEDGAPFLDKTANKAYLVQGKIWVNNHAHVLKSKTNNKFLMYYLNWFDYFDYVSGTTRLKLNQAMMKKIPFPIVSRDIKEEIVDKIEKAFAILDVIN
ncbi:MAG: hypothetical protein E7175_03240 [Erysipelotrichaceae bacterium]|nr:hypothetical protein [Erysipelotrichaceae bacterium]